MHNQNMKNFICLLILITVFCSGLSSGLSEVDPYLLPMTADTLHSSISPDNGSGHSSICTEELLGRQPILQVLRRGRQAYAFLRLRLEASLTVRVLPLLYAMLIRHIQIPVFYPVALSIVMIIHYIQQIDGKKSRFLFLSYIA